MARAEESFARRVLNCSLFEKTNRWPSKIDFHSRSRPVSWFIRNYPFCPQKEGGIGCLRENSVNTNATCPWDHRNHTSNESPSYFTISTTLITRLLRNRRLRPIFILFACMERINAWSLTIFQRPVMADWFYSYCTIIDRDPKSYWRVFCKKNSCMYFYTWK